MRRLELTCLLDCARVQGVVREGGWELDAACEVLARHGQLDSIALLHEQSKDYPRALSFYLQHLDFAPQSFATLSQHCLSLCRQAKDESAWALLVSRLVRMGSRPALARQVDSFLGGLWEPLVGQVSLAGLAELCGGMEGAAGFWVGLWATAYRDYTFLIQTHKAALSLL